MARPPLGRSVASAVASLGSTTIDRLAIIGAGEVVRRKLWPVVQANGFDLDGIAVRSLEDRDPLDIPPHSYHRVDPDSLLPLDPLEAAGFLTSTTLWIVATPSGCHVDYAMQLAGFSRVAVEKPLAANSTQARPLRPFAHGGSEVYPIDHKLFNASVLSFVDACHRNPAALNRIRHIEARFFEAGGISHSRQQEDCIADVQHHLLVPILAMFR